MGDRRAHRARAPGAVGAWLVARTGQAVEERDDGTLVTFAPDEARPSADRGARARGGPGAAETSRRRLESVDWAIRWRDGLGPRRFGRLTVIAVLGRRAPTDRRARSVVLDPETAFGSGEHGSTRAALTLLERQLRPGDRVLDLGSGSGILAIAAVKLGAARAIGIENDRRGEPGRRAQRRAERRRGPRSSSSTATRRPRAAARSRRSRSSPTSSAPSTPRCCRRSSPRSARRPRDLLREWKSAEAPLFRPALDGGGSRSRDEVTRRGLVGGRRAAARDHGPARRAERAQRVSGDAWTTARRITCGCAERERRVKRSRCGTAQGLSASAVWSRSGKAWEVEVESHERTPAPPRADARGRGAGDRDRFAWLVEKAAELGVTRSSRSRPSGPRASRRGSGRSTSDKLRRQALEAIKQCGAPWAARGRGAGRARRAFVAAAEQGVALAGRCRRGAAARRRSARSALTVVVGPEGGLDRRASAPRLVGRGLPPLALGAAHAPIRDRGAGRGRRGRRRTDYEGPMADCLFCKIVAGEIPAKIVKRSERRPGVPGHRSQGADARAGDPDPPRAGGAGRQGRRGRALLGEPARASRPRWRASWVWMAGGYRIVTNTGQGRGPERGSSALPPARRAEDDLAAGLIVSPRSAATSDLLRVIGDPVKRHLAPCFRPKFPLNSRASTIYAHPGREG